MSKAYIITYTISTSTKDYKPQTRAVEFSKENAEKAKRADMRNHRKSQAESNIFSYNEDNGLIVFNEGAVKAIQWSIEEVEVTLPLTNIQVTELNRLAECVYGGDYSFEELEDVLFDEEVSYLKDIYKRTYNEDIEKKGK